MFKTFVFGLFFGALVAGALIYFVPAVDLHRERSLISVQPNIGNIEIFQINLPRDRILVGLPGVDDSIPAELDWPGVEYTGGMQAELFKLRNSDNTVIGVASRIASSSEATGSFIEWTLHFPARGTIYALMDLLPTADGMRNGTLRAGTRDFATLSGSVREQFVTEVNGDDGNLGRIEIRASLVAPHGESE